ncbi:MAG: hypothetical protein ITG02_06680 [Patulibacter sp.]|nr:hypothetical protein [Patulibacter sp.]
MHLNVTPSPQPTATLVDAANLKALSVAAPAEITDDALMAAVAPWGRLDGDHVWLRIARLREAVVAAGTDGAAFDGMIDYARGAGWVDDANEHVRAHVERAGS